MTAYMARASYGDRPAYIDWKDSTRSVRGSCRNCRTFGASLRNPPMAASRARLGVRVGADVEVRTVRVEGPVERVDGDEVEPVLQSLADTVQRVGDQVRHGQHRGSGVEPVAAVGQQAGPPAGGVRAFDDGDLAPGADQPQRRGQPGKAGTHHDDVVGGAGNGAQ